MLAQNRSANRNQASAYREYSRKRYTEMKNEMTALREPEIVAKIIREWETMSMDQRQRYLKNEMVPLKIEPVSTPNKEMQMTKGKTNQKTTGGKKMEKSDLQEGSDMQMEEVNIREFDDSSSPKMTKAKGITKKSHLLRSDYLSFFKSYFCKLQREHPRWTSYQITSIIKLLWRRKKSADNGSVKSTKSRRLAKPMTGRMAFMRARRAMEMNPKALMMKWKRLPIETRINWRNMGNPDMARKMPMRMMTTMKLSPKMMTGEMRMMSREMMMPGEMKMMPGEMKMMPGEMKMMPGEMKMMTGEMKMMPGEMRMMMGAGMPIRGELDFMNMKMM